MKIDITTPDGGHIHFERTPLTMEKFYALCTVAAGAMVCLVFCLLIVK